MKEILLVLMEALVCQKKNSILTLVKQRQNFAGVYIVTIIVIYLLTEKKSLSLKLIMETAIFQLGFV